MPVALKLSKRFYDTFGQEVTNELVDALNAVDISYRAEFRELFGAHFGQLRAETDKLASGLRAELEKLDGELRSEMNRLATELRGEMHALRAHDMPQMESRLRNEFDTRMTRLEGRMDALQERTRGDLKAVKSDLLTWMVGLWFVSVALALLSRIWAG